MSEPARGFAGKTSAFSPNTLSSKQTQQQQGVGSCCRSSMRSGSSTMPLLGLDSAVHGDSSDDGSGGSAKSGGTKRDPDGAGSESGGSIASCIVKADSPGGPSGV